MPGRFRVHFGDARWLSQGVVPEPRQVVQFMNSVLLDHRTAGSGERPFYRNPGQDSAALIERLDPYIQVDRSTARPVPWQSRLHRERDQLITRQSADTMAGDGSERTFTVPVRNTELAALSDLVALLCVTAQPSALGRLAYSLVQDLKARAAQHAGSADSPHDRALFEAIRLNNTTPYYGPE